MGYAESTTGSIDLWVDPALGVSWNIQPETPKQLHPNPAYASKA